MARVPTAARPREWTPPQARIDGDRLLKARQAEQRIMEAKAKVEAEAKRVEEMESQKLDEKVDDLREQLDRLTDDLPKILPSGGGGKRMVAKVLARDYPGLTDLPATAVLKANNLSDVANAATALANLGGMAEATYDPTAVGGDVFDMDNMAEGADTKILTAAERTAIGNLEDVVVTPYDYGASPSDAMSVDQSAAVQAMIDAVVASWDSSVSRYRREASLGGRIWACDSAIDVTQIRNPGFTVKDGAIYSKATGAIAWDMSGANAMKLFNFHVWGDKTNQPGVGILLAKADSGSGTFPDAKQHKLFGVTVNGYFSKASFINFSSEVSSATSCIFQNKSRSSTAYAVIMCSHAGTLDDYVGGVTSSFTTIPAAADGTQSNIIHNMNSVEAMRGADVVLTPTSVSATNPVVITFSSADLIASELVNGDEIYIYNWTGGTWSTLNNVIYTVQNINVGAGTCNLYDATGVTGIDGSALGTWSSGHVFNRTGPAVLLNGVGMLNWTADYWLCYNTVGAVWDTSQGGGPRSNYIKVQPEHGPATVIQFDTGSATTVFQDLELVFPSINQVHKTAILDATGTGTVRIDGLKLTVANMGTAPANGIFGTPARFNVRGMEISTPLAAAMNNPYTAGFAAVPTGTVFSADDNRTRVYGGIRETISASAVASASHTGTTAETLIQSIAMPAGYPGANGKVIVKAYFSLSGTAATKAPRVRIHTAANTGGTVIGSLSVTSTHTAAILEIEVTNRNDAASQLSGPTNFLGYGSTATAKVETTVNTAVAWYLNITMQLTDGADSAILESYEVEVRRRNGA